MVEIDQKARIAIDKAIIDKTQIEIDSINTYYSKLIKSIDSTNTLREIEIVEEYGFIDFVRFDTLCSYNFWLLVQHADYNVDFQKKYLLLFKKNIDKGKKSNYAYLKDRVLVNSSKKQMYGTQIEVIEKNGQKKAVLKPTKFRKYLNKRRKKMGLNTIEEYLQIMNKIISGDIIFEDE